MTTTNQQYRRSGGTSLTKNTIPKGHSLHIGMNKVSPNYGDIAELNACHNDAISMFDIAIRQGYNARMLLSENATYEEVVRIIKMTANRMQSNDIFLITYSGHGSQLPDENGDEPDNLDETWVLYDKMLIDDELHLLWSEFPANSRIVIISDSCHSGTIAKSTKPLSDKEKTPDIKASGILISGCRDNQFSYDGEVNSTFTKALLEVWDSGKFNGSYKQFRNLIAQKLPKIQNPNYFRFGKVNTKFSRQKPFTL